MKKQITTEDVLAYGRTSTRFLDTPRIERDIFDIDEIEAAEDAVYWASQEVKPKKPELQPV